MRSTKEDSQSEILQLFDDNASNYSGFSVSPEDEDRLLGNEIPSGENIPPAINQRSKSPIRFPNTRNIATDVAEVAGKGIQRSKSANVLNGKRGKLKSIHARLGNVRNVPATSTTLFRDDLATADGVFVTPSTTLFRKTVKVAKLTERHVDVGKMQIRVTNSNDIKPSVGIIHPVLGEWQIAECDILPEKSDANMSQPQVIYKDIINRNSLRLKKEHWMTRSFRNEYCPIDIRMNRIITTTNIS